MNLGYFHPQVVHFVVALLAVGVALRWAVLAGTVAAVAAARSDTMAHEAAERVPGVRPVVQQHEEWGEQTRNLFLYEKGMALREAGRPLEAARLFDELVRQSPGDIDAGLVGVQSLIEDRKDGSVALAALVGIRLGADDRRAVRRDFLAAEAWVLDGRADSAGAILQRPAMRFPDKPRIQDRLAKLPR